MSWLLRHRPTPALIISILALIISLGGVAGAQVGLIGSSQIRDGSIQTADLAPGSVTNTRLGANAVTTNKIAANAVRTSDVQAGAIDRGRIAVDAVDHTRVQDGTLDSADLPPEGVLPDRLASIPAVSVAEAPPATGNATVLGPCLSASPLWATVEGTDPFNMHTPNPVNTAYLVAPQAGRYRISATIAWDAADGGSRFFDFQVDNGVTNTAMGGSSGVVATSPVQSSSIEVVLPAGGNVSLLLGSCGHTSGPDLSPSRASRFQLTWVGTA